MEPVSLSAPNQLIIDVNWGLGESIVSGKVTPDFHNPEGPTQKSLNDVSVKKPSIVHLILQINRNALFSRIHPRLNEKCIHLLLTNFVNSLNLEFK